MLKKLENALSRIGLDSFIIGIFFVIFLAYLNPTPGLHESPLHLPQIANYGVSLIFFFYGLKLSKKQLQLGLTNWKLHVLIQLSTFVLFPLLILAIRPLFADDSSQLIWLGIFFMSTLPSTVSSSVVMVSIANGNIPAAIFNASISSLLGIFITPLLMGPIVETTLSTDYDISSILLKLTYQVLVPVTVGLLLNSRLGEWAQRNKKTIKNLDQTTILLIVYTSFCESFEARIFESLSFESLFFLTAGMAGLFFIAYRLITFVSNRLHFSKEDRITATFCGSKKSLVQGAVMAKVLFPTPGQIGIILLPIMIYHAVQLIIVSILAKKIAAQNAVPKE